MNRFSILQKIILALLVGIAYSCGDSDPEPVDCNLAGLSITIDNVVDATCNQDNGEVEVTVNGGDGLEFSIAGSNFQSIPTGSSTITDLPSGSLTVTLRDGDNCTVTGNFTINDINNVTFQADIQNSGCQTSAGSLTATASGGVEPYSFSLDGSALQTDNSFTGLEAGDYTLLVQDSEGCETSNTISVLTGVSYANQIQEIMETNCTISGCHDGESGIPDWTDLSNVQSNSTNIKSRTAAGTMPPSSSGLSLTQDEVDAIGCWVDDGALDN